MPYGENAATCLKCRRLYVTGDCIDLFGECDECKSGQPKYSKVVDLSHLVPTFPFDETHKKALKKKISVIMVDALSGRDQDLRTPDGFIRWGLVEKRIGEAIDKCWEIEDDKDIS